MARVTHTTTLSNKAILSREIVDCRVEWQSVVFSGENRFCHMRVMDVHVYDVDLVSVIFRSEFAHDTQAPPQASWCGSYQLQFAVTFGVSAV